MTTGKQEKAVFRCMTAAGYTNALGAVIALICSMVSNRPEPLAVTFVYGLFAASYLYRSCVLKDRAWPYGDTLIFLSVLNLFIGFPIADIFVIIAAIIKNKH